MSVSKRIANLPPDKLKILLEKLQQRGGAQPKSDRIPKQPRDGRTYTLTHAQESLWFYGELDPENPAYHIPISVGLQGELNAVALERALAEVIRRHEVLRTVFPRVDDHPVQQIQPVPTFKLSWIDLSTLPGDAWEAEAGRLAMREFKRPFPIAEGPLYRFVLIRLRPTEFRLIMIMHHLIIDNWCQALINREIYTLYAAFANGGSSPFPELPLQYADYAVWQRQALSGEKLERLLTYWKNRLQGSPSLEMPLDRKRPPVFQFSGARESLTLPLDLSKALRDLCRRRNVTLFTAMLAAFKCLASRYSGQADLAFGTPIVHRDRVEIEELIGYFVNALVLRTDLSGNPGFQEALARVKQTCLDAYAHQELPFELLVRELNPPRDLSRNPLFQIMFYNQANPRLAAAAASQKSDAAPATGPRGTGFQKYDFDVTRFDLEVEILEDGEEIHCNVMYSTGLFEAETVARLLTHYRVLLAAVAQDDSQKIAQIPLMEEEERQRLVREWSGETPDYPRDRSIQGLFEDMAEAMPDAVAVVQEDQYRTYACLNREANRLAHFLRDQGVESDQPVGLFLERSPQMATAVLATLKAGGAYFPLATNLPGPRLAYMLADGNASLVISSAEWVDRFPETDARVINLEEQASTIARHPHTNPKWQTHSGQGAYLMYTSGSTGKPKGIAIPHHAVACLVINNGYTDFGPGQVFIHIAPISFDASTFELWGSWLHGGKLIMPPPGVQGLDELSQTFQRYRVTTLWLTTGLFNMMVEHHLDGLVGLRAVLTGGEVPSRANIRKVHETYPDCYLVNCYGPTETTTFATFHPVSKASYQGDSVPIGRPLHHSLVYPLDQHMEVVPTNVHGELHIGGESLARGYHYRPRATAQRFIPDAIGSLPGERLYKTGDWVRWLSNGEMEFFGRKDWQIKLRGFRIELGEIEEALHKHEMVANAFVLTRTTSAGDKQLAAFIKPEADMNVEARELRAYLNASMPDYMVPSVFIEVEKLPLNANGKVDRAALAKIGGDGGEGSAHVAPRNHHEEVVAGIWAEVLKVERISIHDNFFELGGHSILATRIASRLREALDIVVPLRLLFERPTVAKLVAHIEETERQGARERGPTLTARPEKVAPPLSFSQERLWFLHQMVPDNPFYNIPTAARVEGRLSLPVLEKALTAIVQRHENLRTTFEMAEGRPVQVVHPCSQTKLPVVDLGRLAASTAEALARDLTIREYSRIFNLSEPPLFRALLMRTGTQAHLWVLTLHHIIADGQSVQVFQGELDAHYKAFLQEKTKDIPVLPVLPIQYADYAWWQRQWLSGSVLEEMLSYWKDQLRGAATTLLPLDRSRPEIATFRGAGFQTPLPKDLRGRIRGLCGNEGLTLFMVMVAAFKATLHHYHGQEDLVVGTPVANRDRPELEGLIGFFLNMLPLRTDLSGNPAFLELAQRVRTVCLDAFSHQDLAFEKLVDELKPQRDFSSHPIFQIAFQLESQPAPAAGATSGGGDLSLGTLDFDPGTTRYDLEIHIRESANQMMMGWVYSTDLFERETVERLARCYQNILVQVAENPQIRLEQLRLLTAEDAQAVIEPASKILGDPVLPSAFQNASSRYWVLDPYDRPAPMDLAGEIAVEEQPGNNGKSAESEPGLAVPHPHQETHPGARLLLTGTIGRRRSQGIEYLGQKEDLVTLQGFPANLDHMERLLNELPGVASAAIITTHRRTGNEVVSAFVVPDAKQSAKPDEIVRVYRSEHPGMPIPSRFIIVETLPEDEHGRIDREQLRETQVVHTPEGVPESELERNLVDLWREALDVEEVSVHDNFFEMGGSSLQIIRLQKQLGAMLKRHVPVIHIFQNPTIRSLARFLTNQGDERQAIQKVRTGYNASAWPSTGKENSTEHD